jgi:predicted RNA methylase
MLPGGPVYLGRDSYYIDAMVLDQVWNEHIFRASCRDHVVVDLGAHKGYFGAWALKHGASYVISCEPQSDNFAVLEQTRSENTRSDDWEVMRIAVGANPGEVSLFVSPE